VLVDHDQRDLPLEPQERGDRVYTVNATATDTAGYSNTRTASVYVQATTTTTTKKTAPGLTKK